MRKEYIISLAFALFIFLGALLTLRVFVGGTEDNWFCVKGKWVKHGNPVLPKPTTNCYLNSK